jgi:cytoskeletal protein CcmA (bactofilin family)
MFSKTKNKKMSKPVTNPNVINIIGKGTSITGDINCDGDIRIDGTLDGNIKADGKILVNKGGVIKGNLSCENCEISGTVEGTLEVNALLSLKETSKIEGDIVTKKLGVEPGSAFNGTCKMGGDNAFKKTGFTPESKEKK